MRVFVDGVARRWAASQQRRDRVGAGQPVPWVRQCPTRNVCPDLDPVEARRPR
jgi:hypothetical protein